MPDNIEYLHVADLLPHTQNIRGEINPDLQELADSIREHGILQPLLVARSDPKPGTVQLYTIVAGHRRARAAMLAGLDVVPCIVRQLKDKTDDTILMLVENTQRKDLNPIEQALALSALFMQGKSQKDLAKMLGRSAAWVSNRLGFLDLSPSTQLRLASGEMTVAQGEHLVRQSRKEPEKKHERGWMPPYLTHTHALARQVRKLCDERRHTGRQRIGKVGCGQCWEYIIRQDERKIVEIEQRLSEPDEARRVRTVPAPHQSDN